MITMTTEFYPFVLTSYPAAHDNSDADFRDMFARTADIARQAIREQSFYVAIAWGAGSMTAAQRKLIAQLLQDFPQEYMDRVWGSYVIAPAALTRGVMTALRWIAPKLVMVEMAASIDAAIREGTTTLRKHRVVAKQSLVDGATAWLEREKLAAERIARPNVR